MGMGDLRNDYQEEDVEEILRRAARIESAGARRERETLVRTAAEIGISEESLALAEAEYAKDRSHLGLEDAYRTEQRREFFEHLSAYVGVNAFLIAINLLRFHGSFWAIWPLLGWGLGLYFHAMRALNPNNSEYQAGLRRYLKRKGRKAREAPHPESPQV